MEIPDGLPTGVSVAIQASGLTAVTSLAVSVDISHTYRGDLVLELYKDGTKVGVLTQNVGGSANDLVDTFTLLQSELPADANGTWILKVIDTTMQYTGTVNEVVLSFST